MSSLIACMLSTGVARAQEPLVDLVIPRAPAPPPTEPQGPRPPARGNSLLPGPEAVEGGPLPGGLTPDDRRAALGLVMPDETDLLTLGTGAEVDLDGRLRNVWSLTGRVFGVQSGAQIEATLFEGVLALDQVTLSLFDPDYRWSFEAGDHQTIDGTVRGARAGWRNGLIEPSLAIGRRLDGTSVRGEWLGSAGLRVLLGDHLTLGGEASTSGRTRAELELDAEVLRLGARAFSDSATGERGLLFSGALAGFARQLEASWLGSVGEGVAGRSFALQGRLGLRLATGFESAFAYGYRGDTTDEPAHSLLGRVGFTLWKTLVVGASWQSTLGLVDTHQASLRLRLRPSRYFEASASLDAEPLHPERSVVEAELAWTPTRHGVVRVGTTVPMGALLPSFEASVEQRLFAAVDLRLEAARDGEGGWSARVGFGASIGFEVPARGAEISGRVFGPDGRGLPDVVVMAGSYRCRTDPEGAFSFTPLEAGGYAVEVDRMSLPAQLAVAGSRQLVQLDRLGSAHLAFQVVAYAKIAGRACLDRDGDARCGPGEGQALGLFRLGHRMTAPEPDGTFAFDNVMPGAHTVTLDADYLKKGFELASDAAVTLDVVQGRAGEVVFVFREKRRAIKFDEL